MGSPKPRRKIVPPVDTRATGTRMHLTLALLVLTAVLPQELRPLAAADARKFRAAFGEALAASEPGEWKTVVAQARTLERAHGRAALLELVAEGPERERGLPKARKVGKKKEALEEFGRVTSGFAFAHDGRTFGYAVDIPKAYDGKKPFALLIDPGHGSGAELDARGKADFLPFFRNQLEVAGLEDWLVVRTEIVEQVGAGGKLGERPEDEVAAIFAAFRRDVLTRFAVDPARVYVSGLSQTGFWSWYLGRELADRFAGIAPMGAVTWGVDPALENLRNLPTFVIHGANDAICKVGPVRATTQRMRELGLPFEYLELPEGAHDVGTWGRLSEGLAWLVAHPPERAPEKVNKVLGTLANPWAHWVRVDSLARLSDGRAASKPTARVEARIEGQRILLASDGVERLSLWLTSELVDLEQDVEVVWNAKSVFTGRPERSAATAVEAVLERCDWRFLPEARIELR
jgi:hypothetical protein